MQRSDSPHAADMRACRSTCTTSTESMAKTATVLLRCPTTDSCWRAGSIDASALEPIGGERDEQVADFGTHEVVERTRRAARRCESSVGDCDASRRDGRCARSQPSRRLPAARRIGPQVRGHRTVRGAGAAPVPIRHARSARATPVRATSSAACEPRARAGRRPAPPPRAVLRRWLHRGTAGRRPAAAVRAHRSAGVFLARGRLARRRRERPGPTRPRRRSGCWLRRIRERVVPRGWSSLRDVGCQIHSRLWAIEIPEASTPQVVRNNVRPFWFPAFPEPAR